MSVLNSRAFNTNNVKLNLSIDIHSLGQWECKDSFDFYDSSITKYFKNDSEFCQRVPLLRYMWNILVGCCITEIGPNIYHLMQHVEFVAR